ncbi:hypothetical protein C7401_13930 [Paraburkholderia unamae]|uniref:hypothetical protein n=1 Tax=Paraburkholderia unamae TaxID=219649 RepID=UPI000DC32E32|nr:hypothetical protein [Paraburkholderia unamae]RAR51198.1 hypothetical protein C7401_13930 [Paraburkholderia unamae]
MADYADTASLSSSRPERSAPSKRRASSPSFDPSGLPAGDDTVNAQAPGAEPSLDPHAQQEQHDAASAPVAAEVEGVAVRQATLSGFETPETGQAEPASADDASAATATRRAARTKRAAAPSVADAEPTLATGDADVALPAAALSEPSFHAADDASAEAPASAVETRLDALQSALADQRRMAAASSRRLKWVLVAASAAVLASVGFGIAQSVRFDSLANESRAEQARLEQFILKQQSSLDDISQRLATLAATPAVAAETPAPARAAVATPAPARHTAARSSRAAPAHHTAKATQKTGQKAPR